MRPTHHGRTVSGVTIVDRDQLLASAKDFADRALRAYLEDDARITLTNAAFSMEHLSKAYLYSLHPALLMEIRNGQLDSLLHLVGHGAKAKKAFPRTISAKEALARVEHVLPALRAPKADLAQLVDVRDGVVHVGYLTVTNTREILTAFLRYANELYDELKVDAGDRWGHHAELVDSRISQALTEIQRDVLQRIAAARLRITELLEKIPEDEHVSVMAARQSQSILIFMTSTQRRADVTCPVCDDEYASYVGEPDYDVDVDVEPDGQGGYTSYIAGASCTLIVERFLCGACELRLEGPDELEAAGLDKFVEDFVDPNPEDYDRDTLGI